MNGLAAVEDSTTVDIGQLGKKELLEHLQLLSDNGELGTLVQSGKHAQAQDHQFLAALRKILSEDEFKHHHHRSFLYSLLGRCDNWRVDEKRRESRRLEWQDIGLLLLLSLMYLLSTPARTHVNGLVTILAADPMVNYSVTRHGHLMFFGILAVSVGKLVTSFFLDLGSPLRWMLVFLLSSALSVLFISQLHEMAPPGSDLFPALVALNALNVFAQCGLVASTNRYLHDHFKPAQYGRSLALVAIGGRIGSLVCALVLGSYVDSIGLSPAQAWAQVSQLASVMCFASIVPLAMVMRFPHPAEHLAHAHDQEYLQHLGQHHAKAPPRHRIHARDQLAHFKLGTKRYIHWFRSRSFLLICLANAGMAASITGEGFEGFLSVFIRKSLGTDSGMATAQVAIFLHLGAIASLILGGVFVEALDRPSQSRIVLCAMGIGCLGLVGLLVTTGHDDDDHAARTSFFCLGLGFGYPFYVTVSKFAIHYGGEHAAMVTQTIALFSYAVCAILASCIGIIVLVENGSWYYCIVMLLVLGVAGWMAMLLYDFLQWEKKTKQTRERAYRLVYKHLFMHNIQAVAHRFDSTAFSHRRKSTLYSALATGFMLSAFVLAFVGLGVSLQYTSGSGIL